MFNQEPAEEQGQTSEAPGREAEPKRREEGNSDSQNLTELNTHKLDYKKQKSEIGNQNLEFTNSVAKIQKCDYPVSDCEDQSSGCPRAPEGCGFESRRSFHSEEGVDCVLQVDNGSDGDDGFLQREGSQRRSRRRFRRVNPRGERELITDGQEPVGYSTVREPPSLQHSDHFQIITVGNLHSMNLSNVTQRFFRFRDLQKSAVLKPSEVNSAFSL